MNGMLLICLASLTIFLASPSSAEQPVPKHFFTQDTCQYWKLKDDDDLIEYVWFARSEEGIQIKQGFTIDAQNSFFQLYDFINDAQTQINLYAKSYYLCSSSKITQEERDAAVILSHEWEKMKANPKYLETSGDDKKWTYDAIRFLGANHTDTKYVERDGRPHKLKFFDEKGKLVRKMTVVEFETNCESVQREFQNDAKECQKAEQSGTGFADKIGKRGANSVRLPGLDHSDRRSIREQNHTQSRESGKCTKEGAKKALQRAIETKSMEYGNWCGVGGEKGVCCQTVCPDGGYDVLCRKHDSSTYWISLVGVTISPCACDAEFVRDSEDFDGCIGDENAPWRVDPDPTGAVTCEKTKEAAVETFYCMPCVNFDCKKDRVSFPNWQPYTDCEWVTYWGKDPEEFACDGPCWDEEMKPWSYRAWYDTPKC